jgi:molybdate transport system substrate-binding protein
VRHGTREHHRPSCRWSGCALLLAVCLMAVSTGSRAQCAPTATNPAGELLVFGAASMTDVLEELGREYRRETRQPVKFSFASSSTLARQIESGAPADVFVSADVEWMDYVQSRGLIDRTTRFDVAGNRLALVAPVQSQLQLRIEPGFALAAALGTGRLATGDPDFVPAGRYAKSALIALGAWDDLEDRLVRAENVRAALVYVARGEVPLGIVYETDARVEKRVRVVDTFPPSSHPPINYPVAVTTHAGNGAREFVTCLRSEASQKTLRRFGFQPATAR